MWPGYSGDSPADLQLAKLKAPGKGNDAYQFIFARYL